MKRLGILILAIFLTGGSPAWAGPGTKLGRGISNVGFGWFEIVNEIGTESDRHGFWIGLPSGLVRGSAYGILRMLAGAYETVTFLLPNGEKGYEAVLLPESVFKRR